MYRSASLACEMAKLPSGVLFASRSRLVSCNILLCSSSSWMGDVAADVDVDDEDCEEKNLEWC